jgi:hypothetical protein
MPLTVIIPLRPANQPTVLGVAPYHKKVGDACYTLILQTNCVTLCSKCYFTLDFLYITLVTRLALTYRYANIQYHYTSVM